MTNCYADSVLHGIETYGSGRYKIDADGEYEDSTAYIDINNCTIKNVWGYGIRSYGSAKGIIKINANILKGFPDSIGVDYGTSAEKSGIWVENKTSYCEFPSEHISILGNDVSYMRGHGILCASDTTYADTSLGKVSIKAGNIIHHNQISGITIKQQGNDSTWVDDVIIEGNTIFDNNMKQQSGLLWSQISILRVDQAAINNNRIYRNLSGGTTSPILFFESDNCVARNNDFRREGSNGRINQDETVSGTTHLNNLGLSPGKELYDYTNETYITGQGIETSIYGTYSFSSNTDTLALTQNVYAKITDDDSTLWATPSNVFYAGSTPESDTIAFHGSGIIHFSGQIILRQIGNDSTEYEISPHLNGDSQSGSNVLFTLQDDSWTTISLIESRMNISDGDGVEMRIRNNLNNNDVLLKAAKINWQKVY